MVALDIEGAVDAVAEPDRDLRAEEHPHCLRADCSDRIYAIHLKGADSTGPDPERKPAAPLLAILPKPY